MMPAFRPTSSGNDLPEFRENRLFSGKNAPERSNLVYKRRQISHNRFCRRNSGIRPVFRLALIFLASALLFPVFGFGEGLLEVVAVDELPGATERFSIIPEPEIIGLIAWTAAILLFRRRIRRS